MKHESIAASQRATRTGTEPAEPSRRAVLALAAAPLAARLAPALALAGTSLSAQTVPTDTITVLYRRDTVNGPTRLDPAVQAAALALEDEFAKRGFRVVQPSAQVSEMLDQGPAIAVTFAPDAGFSMLFSVFKSMRPMPGMDKGLAEVILRCRVFVGHSILVAEEGKGMMAASTAADVREFAERRSAEQAAQRAAGALADKVARRLKALAPADIERMASLTLPPGPTFQAIALPPEPPKPPAPPPVAAAPAPAAVAPAAAAAPAPVAAAAPAVAASVPLPAPARKFALVIAVSDYSAVRQRLGGQGPSDLKGVAVDRRNLMAGLQSIGFPAENVQVLADAQATSASVREHLGKLVAATRSEDLVLIAISAHGAPANEVPSGFGMPVLSDFSRDNRNAIDFWQLQSMVRNMPAQRTVLVVDTCHSGGAAGMMSAVVSPQGVSVQQQGAVTPEPARMAQAAQGESTRAFAVLAASRPEEYSLEDSSGGGLFTSRLVRGLQTSKGEQALEGLFREHVEKQVIAESQVICKRMGNCKGQTPMFAFSGRGNQIRF